MASFICFVYDPHVDMYCVGQLKALLKRKLKFDVDARLGDDDDDGPVVVLPDDLKM